MMGNKIPDGSASPCQLGFIGQMNNQNIQFIIIGCGVGAEPFVAADVVFEGGLDIRAVPPLGLGLINPVQQIDGKILESSLVEALGKGLSNEGI